MPKEYVLFNIRIRGAGPEYGVDVQSALGGDASGSFTPPSADARYQELAARLQQLDTDEDMLIELGSILFQALFRNAVKQAYARSQGGLGPDQGLRVRLDLDPTQAAVAGLPWEFLYDPDQGPLALLDAPIVRYLPQPTPTPTLATSLPLKVLLTGAFTPPEPDVERELAEVRAALGPLEQSGHIAIQVEEHLTQTILQRRLREGFRIWHFVGHGGWSKDGRSGTLLFEDGTGSSKAVSAAELNILLNRSGLRLVVLDACNSAELKTEPYRSVAPALVRAQVPAVIAMQFSVPQEATPPFAGEFYRALGEGLPIDACVTEGRKAVMNETGLRNPDWGIPVVYTRAPDGKLFELPASAPGGAPSSASGINISIGSGNTLQQGSSINVGNVGSTTIGGIGGDQAGPAQTGIDDGMDEQIAALEAQVRMYGRQIDQLQLQIAKTSITTASSTMIELEDNENAQIAAMNRIVKLRSERVDRLKQGGEAARLAEAQRALLNDSIRAKQTVQRVLERKDFGGSDSPYPARIAAVQREIDDLQRQLGELGGQ